MNKQTVQRILCVLVMAAVMVYTFYNYHTGKTEFLFFITATAVLAYPMVSMICRIISDLQNR